MTADYEKLYKNTWISPQNADVFRNEYLLIWITAYV